MEMKLPKRPPRLQKKTTPRPPQREAGTSYLCPPQKWFYTFMCMNIPIAGWIYLYRLSRNPQETQLRDFARAYLWYKLVFLGVALILLLILAIAGWIALDRLLAYMELL